MIDNKIRKVELCGRNMEGARVGFFYGSPIDAEKQRMSSGVFDICHKKHYPPPGETIDLIQDKEIITELGFHFLQGYTKYTKQLPGNEYFPTAAASWGACMLQPEIVDEVSDRITYDVFYSAWGSFIPGAFARAYLDRRKFSIALNAAHILPEWIKNKHISFQLVVAPRVGDMVSDFVNIRVADQLCPCDGIYRVLPLGKNYFIDRDFTLSVECLPSVCSFNNARSLEVPLPSGTFGGWFQPDYTNAFQIQVVKDLGCPYVLITPEQRLKYRYISLVDPIHGEVIGPAISWKCFIPPVES